MTDSQLHIAPDLALPLDAVTETFLIFGKKGSGKTATACVLTEELITAGLPVAVIDPMGAWWGLRSSADGAGPGLPVLIFGGEHADLPLAPDSGTVIADLVVEERVPVVLDLFLMSKTQQRHFVTDFMERLFRRNRDPLHLVIDEADRWAPQRGTHDMARLLGAYEDIVLRGRRLGIGSTSITLRVAQLHAAIRSQVEVLVAMRMLGRLDVQAIDEWVRLHATEEDAAALKASLPSLPVGTAWFWSPGWLEIMQRVQVRPRATFDSSATPKVGEQRIVPREFARVAPGDLERLAARLTPPEPPAPAARTPAKPGPVSAETTRLRSEVADLRARLATAESRQPDRVEVPVLAPGDLAALEQVITALRDVAGGIELALSRAAQPAPPAPPAAVPKPAAGRRPDPPRLAETDPGAVVLGKSHRAFLTVLAQFPAGRSRTQLAMLSGYSARSSMMDKALSQLRTAGLVEPGQPYRVTPAGVEALGGAYEPLPTGPALIEAWMGKLGKAERAFLQLLLDAWPAAMTRAEIAAATGYSGKSSMVDKALSRLRTLELVRGTGQITADETLAQQATRCSP